MQTFLIRDKSGREAVMRLPVGRTGGITTKGHKMIAQRFYDGITETPGRMQYALNLEYYRSGKDLIEAITRYYKNEV